MVSMKFRTFLLSANRQVFSLSIGFASLGFAETQDDPAFSAQPVAVNQVGYVTERPKRFTAPLAPDGSDLVLRVAEGGEEVMRGKIMGGIGDFSAYQPVVSDRHYVVEVGGGETPQGVSDAFLVQPGLLQDQFWQSAVDFLIDSRSVIGTHPSAYGACPWRDGTYYDAILPALVMFYLADPAKIEAMPRQIDWSADKARVEDPNFKYVDSDWKCEGALEATRDYFQLAPPSELAPDVIKMIHWGAGYYLGKPETHDPSMDPVGKKIHSQTLEQMSYVLWAWPSLEKWLPRELYERSLALVFEHWVESGALGIPEMWHPKTYLKPEEMNPRRLHPYKGRHAPGHSIVPNLLMHEVAKREGRQDAPRYLEAAVKQAAWCIENLDWNDPRTTKGHRMAEHRTIPNLVWLLQKYPNDAPAGLKEKIGQWVDVAISRSENLWDYRRFDMDQHWSIPDLNDVGNLLSLPAIATAAKWVIDDPEKKSRLDEIAYAAVDHIFGRNPRLAASPAQPEQGFPEAERGWPERHQKNVCARLELTRGSISSSPGTEMFPFNPKGKYRHLEGWVNYGASWCISLAYLHLDTVDTTPKP